MKKIVSNIAVVGTQLLVGTLFLVMLFSGSSEDDMVVVVKNNSANKMSDVVTTLFMDNKEKEKEASNNVDNTVVEELNTDSSEEVKPEEEKPEEEKPAEETPVVEEPTPVEPVPVEEPPVVAPEPAPAPVSLGDIGRNIDTSKYSVIVSHTGSLTGYGPDCYGCSGYTASGHNARESAVYNDSEFGNIRILAGDGSVYPLYSIVRVTIPGQSSFIGIVLDTGGNVGFGKGTLFDLLAPTESQAMGKTDNVLFERLR